MATVRDNEFYLNLAGIANFQFDVEEYSITKGQPWEGVTTETRTAQGELVAHAGRKGSSDVADWFVQKLDQGSCVGNSSSSSVPGKLNFAFFGTMTFEHNGKTITVKNVLIGQGHSTRNTWWLGGPKMSGTDTPMGGIVKSPTTNPTRFVTFTSLVTYISQMDMGVFSL